MELNGFTLFENISGVFTDFLKNLSDDEISESCDYKIFNRGIEYFESGLVKQVTLDPENNILTAVVRGTEKYIVSVFQNKHEIQANCTCPYEDVCKHIVAVLLYIAENEVKVSKTVKDNIKKTEISSDYFHQYLEGLTKKELMNLVDHYAPQSFKNEIKNRKSDTITAQHIFKKAQKKIIEFFSDEELLFDPSDFEASLIGQLEKLKGLENQLNKEIGELIIYIINEVEHAFNEGYLYIDNYEGDEYFESEEFCDFVTQYVKQLLFIQKIEYLQHLDKILKNMSYNTFEDIAESFDNYFLKNELTDVKNMIIGAPEKFDQSFISRLYYVIMPHFSEKEKELILLYIKGTDSCFLIELIELLNHQERYNEVHSLIGDYLSDNKGFVEEKIMELFLQVVKKLNLEIYKPACEAISRCPSASMLFTIKNLAGNDTRDFESSLKLKRPEELLHFYEKEKRFQDALLLIKETKGIWEGSLFEFFKRNKKFVSTEAEQYFLNRINKNLMNTGDNYYHAVVETLSHLKQINQVLSDQLLKDIRLNYKRRPKLISMLSKL